jgi:hypothetical protein
MLQPANSPHALVRLRKYAKRQTELGFVEHSDNRMPANGPIACCYSDIAS